MEDPRIISALFIFLKMAYYNVLINTMGGFTVVRGKHPIGKGSDDTILLFIREDYTGNITDFSVIMIDGKEYIPNVYYDVDGRKVEG